MKDSLQMAKGGRIYLFGHENFKLNPIEFFMTMLAQGSVAPRTGINRLATFFFQEVDSLDKANF